MIIRVTNQEVILFTMCQVIMDFDSKNKNNSLCDILGAGKMRIKKILDKYFVGGTYNFYLLLQMEL